MRLASNSMLGKLSDADAALCVRLNRANRVLWVNRFFVAVSRLGDGVFWYALMALLLLGEGETALPGVTHMVLVGAVALALYKWLKRKTLRPRPCDLHPGIVRGTAPLDEFSFPSGHTLHAVSFTVVALAYFPWLAPIVLPFTALVAISRVVLGLHYPTDVLAGAALGYALATASFLL